MPIVFVHGVSVREDKEQEARNAKFRQFVLPDGDDGIFNPLWGKDVADSIVGGSYRAIRYEEYMKQDYSGELEEFEPAIEEPDEILEQQVLMKSLRTYPEAIQTMLNDDRNVAGRRVAGTNLKYSQLASIYQYAIRTDSSYDLDAMPLAAGIDWLGPTSEWILHFPQLRNSLTLPLIRFSGDVFLYLGTRDKDNSHIMTVVTDALLKAKAAAEANGKPLIIVAHSGSSLIVYDILTHYIKDIEVDALITVGSQIGLFMKLGIFKNTAKAMPSNVNNWLNVLDTDDVLSFSIGKHLDKQYEECVEVALESTNGVLSHTEYFEDDRFYKLVRTFLIRQLGNAYSPPY